MMLRAKRQATSAASRYGLVFVASLCLFVAVAGGATAAVGLSPERSGNTISGQQDETIYKVGKDVRAPILLYQVNPEFPASERHKKGPFHGSCVLGLIVDASGNLRDIHVVRSLSKDFDEKAVEAVEQYRFSPAERAGKPVSVALYIDVNFAKF